MNKEDYVSYKVAEILKDKKLDIEISVCNTKDMCMYEIANQRLWRYDSYNIEIDRIYTSMTEKDFIKAPSLYYAQKWLREKKNISVEPFAVMEGGIHKGYISKIVNLDNMHSDNSAYGDTYEESLNNGIEVALEYK